jgi:hypothetical protein
MSRATAIDVDHVELEASLEKHRLTDRVERRGPNSDASSARIMVPR